MRPALIRIAIWAPLVILALLLAAYIIVHQPLAADDNELHQVALDPADPSRERVGDLIYRGGLDIPRMGQNVGGLSGLRWDAESGRLLAITDDARWVWFTLEEDGDRLTGIAGVEVGNLLGLEGEVLTSKEQGDSESITRSANGGWLVGFERDHRILIYPRGFEGVPHRSSTDPDALFGGLEENTGIEAQAEGDGTSLLCAERLPTRKSSNCALYSQEYQAYFGFAVDPPPALASLGAVPTDADALADGTFLILFRSYSPTDGNSAAIVAYTPDRQDRQRREIAVIRPPLTVDNFEGLAVREEEDRTFLYIVSDDNFSGSQRTLLMKFEVFPETE